MIVIEGADLSGKSTLANYMGLHYRTEPIHLGRPPIGVRHYNIVKEALANNDHRTVYDRMMVGSYVFGQFKHDEYNKNSATLEEMLQWMKLIVTLQGKVVACDIPLPVAIRRYDERGDDYIGKEDLITSHSLYRSAFLELHRVAPYAIIRYNSAQDLPAGFMATNETLLQRAMIPSQPGTADRRAATVKAFL